MKLITRFIAFGLILAYAGSAFGAVSAEEAKKLGTTLTAVGAEKAGNADGSIPPYTGGLTTPPASFKPGSGIRPNPFANEKPLFTINAKNMDQHANKLTEGTKALMKKYPTYRIDVYKTHRTVSMPQSVLDNTALNAVRARTSNNGLTVNNAKGGFPFPIPKDGYEAMWNHLLRYDGVSNQGKWTGWLVDSTGRKYMTASGVQLQYSPYYGNDNKRNDIFNMTKNTFIAPARRVGERLMVYFPLNMGERSHIVWQYLPGQRRVKLAPELGHDTPNASSAGATTYDDTYMFNGSMERYNFKLIGKKEMYVPYNEYKMTYEVKADELIKPNHVNPDDDRWELHRVWVVEATLKPGQRHIYSKRVFYLDEDSWAGLASEQYDMRGNLYRVQLAPTSQSYDMKAFYSFATISYDLISGIYAYVNVFGAEGGYQKYETLKDAEWNAESLAGSGIR